MAGQVLAKPRDPGPQARQVVEVDLVHGVVGPLAVRPRARVVLDVGAAAGIVRDDGDLCCSRPTDLARAAPPDTRELGGGQSAGPHRDGHVLELGAAAAPSPLEPVGAAQDGLVGDDHRARVAVGDPVGLTQQPLPGGGAEPLGEPLKVTGVGEPLDADPVVPAVGTGQVGPG